MFPRYAISSITNGVHVRTWAAPALRDLFDRYVPDWRAESLNLRYAMRIPVAEIQRAHVVAKTALLDEVRLRTGVVLRPDVLTIGFARRATAYKRGALLFSDVERLRRIARDVGPLQVVYAGKAHPHDGPGKDVIRAVFHAARELGDLLPVVYLANYDTALGQLMCAGVDLWLNTPQKPQEASGTSGMKAAVNGVPSLSVLDGWWVEGCVEGVTGWAIGDSPEVESDAAHEAASLYDTLEHKIIPLFYGRPSAFGEVMQAAIALNGSFFGSQRMMLQYVHQAYAR
jgi:starch phosphorylase